MVFAGLEFWWAFAAFYGVFLLVRGHVVARKSLLLLGSIILIGLWNSFSLVLLAFVTIVSFGAGWFFQRWQKKKLWTLWLTIVVVLMPLVYFKLTIRELTIIFPLGISFFTFQALSYVIDVYTGKIAASRSIFDHALFLAFFPKFVAGPLERAGTFLPQLNSRFSLSGRQMNEAFFLILWGLVLKFVIAPSAGPYFDSMYGSQTSVASIPLSGPLALSLQIYAEFSGYTNIALGIALLLGIRLTDNFFCPYFSANPSEFWRRWHISLSSWVREYIYFPLGGSRAGAWITSINLLATMLVMGLWHGVTAPYIYWGIYHGMLLVLYRMGPHLAGPLPILQKIPGKRVFAILFFFLLTSIGWMLFVSQSVDQFVMIVSTMGSAFLHVKPLLNDSSLFAVLLLALPVFLMDAARAYTNDQVPVLRLPWPAQILACQACVYALVFFTASDSNWFLYALF